MQEARKKSADWLCVGSKSTSSLIPRGWRSVLCSLNAVSVVNTVITHRVHYAEEPGRIVGVFSYGDGCVGVPRLFLCVFRKLKIPRYNND